MIIDYKYRVKEQGHTFPGCIAETFETPRNYLKGGTPQAVRDTVEAEANRRKKELKSLGYTHLHCHRQTYWERYGIDCRVYEVVGIAPDAPPEVKFLVTARHALKDVDLSAVHSYLDTHNELEMMARFVALLHELVDREIGLDLTSFAKLGLLPCRLQAIETKQE